MQVLDRTDPDPLGAVRELHQVLQPGGALLVSVWAAELTLRTASNIARGID